MTETIKTDVLIVGAGVSGIPAAIAAARIGANVLLIEEDLLVGGAPLDFYISSFCGGPTMGITKEIDDILEKEFRISDKKGPHFFLPSSFQRVLMFLLNKEKRLKVITNLKATKAIVKDISNNLKVCGVKINNNGYNITIESKITIDATGTGAIATLSGCRAMYGRDSNNDFKEEHAPKKRDNQVQQCTWMYISQQLTDVKPFNMMKLDNVKLGVLANGVGWFHQKPQEAIKVKPNIFLHWGCAVECKDTRDPIEISKTQAEALKAMERDHALLRENGYAIYMAPKIGIREVNRVLGEHVITENDLRSGVLPDDTIATGNYSLDIWGENLPQEVYRLPLYGIPYRAVVPKDVDGLLLAGMSISGTHIAMSAYRVMPIVGSIGQATGVAAAICVKQNIQPREVNPAEIIEILKEQNVNFGL